MSQSGNSSFPLLSKFFAQREMHFPETSPQDWQVSPLITERSRIIRAMLGKVVYFLEDMGGMYASQKTLSDVLDIVQRRFHRVCDDPNIASDFPTSWLSFLTSLLSEVHQDIVAEIASGTAALKSYIVQANSVTASPDVISANTNRIPSSSFVKLTYNIILPCFRVPISIIMVFFKISLN